MSVRSKTSISIENLKLEIDKNMAVHLIKLAVGVDSIVNLADPGSPPA